MNKKIVLKTLCLNLLLVIILFGIGTKVQASPNILFNTTDVKYHTADKSVIRVEGIFSNYGDATGKVNKVVLKVKCTDDNKNLCLDDTCAFGNVNLVLQSGESRQWTFYIQNSNNTGYDGQWQWNVNANVSWSAF